MSLELTWLGHNTWRIKTPKYSLLIDPFLNDNPKSPIQADQAEPDFILISHGHFDHIADAVSIAKRTGATVLTNFEISNWLQSQGVAEDQCIGMNPGGAVQQPFGKLKMTTAHHSSSLPDGSYGGVACGLLLEIENRRIYFACDTALFLDMRLIGVGGLDLAVLPIGDLFTMGVDDSIEAIKLLGPQKVAPCHYNTWPPIEQDASDWANRVRRNTAAEPLTPAVAEPFAL